MPSQTRRFERIHDVVENVERYKPGGYCPILLGDVLDDGRYEIKAKLGYGEFSTVWMAIDTRDGTQVAIKINTADANLFGDHELEMLKHLSQIKTSPIGTRHVLRLLHDFEHTSPNGRHQCLVLPLMLSDVNELRDRNTKQSPSYVRALARQLLSGLELLHSEGIVHRDIQPGNLLLTSPNYPLSLKEAECCKIEWLPVVEPDSSAPEYLMPSQRHYGALEEVHERDLLLVIGDLGGAIWARDASPELETITPTLLRAPELVHRTKWDTSIDIWSAACIFEIATSEPLFALGLWGMSKAEIDREYLEEVAERVAPGGLEEHLRGRVAWPDQEVDAFAKFLRAMLCVDPEERLTASQLLQHSWLTDGTVSQ